jgi:hypothetical protein
MLAGISIQAGIRQPQPLNRLSSDDVRFHDLFDIGRGNVSIPDCVRVDHDVRPVLALIKTAGLIGPDLTLQSALGEFLLEQFLQRGFGARITASARMPDWALVAANKNMFFEFWHGVLGIPPTPF